jgi:2-phospho-L-lactate transferase/gluconeogenesis factor (CofD/UPF0052 family)
MPSSLDTVRVVLFSGGRGSGVLSKQLLKDPHVQLTLAINGYDDGASTGEVRRFLGDSLGPSDFRKNASRLALELGTCPAALIELLDARLPDGLSRSDAIAALRQRGAGNPAIAERIDAFVRELDTSGRPFNFNDCSVGNLVFAGSFLVCARQFNRAVDDYCSLVGLQAGVIDNVTDGTNAYLVAIGEGGGVLGSEEEIVGALGQNRIQEIFLIDRALSDADRAALQHGDGRQAADFFAGHAARVSINPRLAARLAEADLIIYAPGTQHSSLFPSYLTPGMSDVIAQNLRAIKLLITNIQSDAEIAGSSAVDIIERALFYLNDKGQRARPTPCLITHYIVNDPAHVETATPYVPLGQIEALEDPRLVRIANYEEGVSGRHDAAKILGPFVRSLVERRAAQRLAILLHDAGSINKVTQTLVEMVRGGISDVAVDATVFYEGDPLDRAFVASLPFGVRNLAVSGGGTALRPSPTNASRTNPSRTNPSTPNSSFEDAIRDGAFDYVMLFESSGMYRGEDLAVLASHLVIGRLDAVWGSRRLSVRDIAESIRFRYEKTPFFGALSAAGSHVLSLACLTLYGRYISDTLSGVRAIRAEDALSITVPLTHKRANQHVLARLLRRKAEILEIPVQFLPISPERVRRTSVRDGLGALGALLTGRIVPAGAASHAARRNSGRSHETTDERRTTPATTR